MPFAITDHWVWSTLGLLAIPALVALNGLFVAAEFALVAVRKTQVEEMVRQGISKARMLEHAVTHLDRSIAATQLGITFTSIALGWVGEPALARLLQPLFSFLPGEWSAVAGHSAATTVAFVFITFMHVVFGELIPKTIALQMPDRSALWLAVLLNAFAKITRPFIVVMNGLANSIIRLLGFQPARGDAMVHSVEELALLIEDTEEAGILAPDQAELVQNVFRLSGKRIRDCMVPKEKMASLELNTPSDRVLEIVRQSAHTRMPVYEGGQDNVVGIVNTKDLFYLFSLKGVAILHDAIYPAIYLKPDDSVKEALQIIRKEHKHMALVRDAEGKILGLVTLEDILEEIVGDIEDEHDRPTPKVIFRKKWPLAKPLVMFPKKKP